MVVYDDADNMRISVVLSAFNQPRPINRGIRKMHVIRSVTKERGLRQPPHFASTGMSIRGTSN